MKPSLQLKLSQHLALTPQLQQSIRLLQLSTMELNTELEQALADNPLLERLDDPLDQCVRLDARGALDLGPAGDAGLAGLGGTAPRSGDGGAPADDATDGRDDAARGGDDGFDGFDDTGGADWGSDAGRGRGDDDDDREAPPLAGGTGTSLREHLLGQLVAARLSRRDRALVGLLIEELDDDGYLSTSHEEILAALPPELEIEPEELAAAHRLLQSFDPAGVGAVDLAECLSLQLAARTTGDDSASATLALAGTIVREHLELLAAHDYTRLKRVLRCDDAALREARTLIRGLDPRPGSAFVGGEAAYVVPDVIVRRTRAGWVAALNSDVVPRLRINDMYAHILRRNRGAGQTLSAQLQEARWLIKNVQQRFDTILRVSQAIVERQKAFFSHGAVAMRPLVLREIAEVLGLHESTVSRVTTQKFMLTPFGTFELKYFFGSHVATDSGGAASSTAIRALIKQLVAAEDTKHPLSDSRIAELLGEQGIVVARRTVAKYREALRIPSVAQRKAL